MQNRDWIVLLQRIPRHQHAIMMLMTLAGIEINIQSVMRMEEDYVVIRGRLAGTTDTGRTFFIPYNQINYVGFNKEIKETQIAALYGEQVPEEAAAPAEMAAAPAPVEPEAAVAADGSGADSPPAAPPSPTPTPKPVERLALPRRSGILARLRARSQQAQQPQPPQEP